MLPKEKNKLAGIFLMAHGGLLGLMYLVIFGAFLAVSFTDPSMPGGLFAVFIGFIMLISSIFVLPQIIGGWKMYKQRPNAKVWGIIASVFACMNVPLGTAAGVFALIFLLSDEGNGFYNALSQPKYLDAVNEADEFRTADFQNRKNPEMHSWR